MADHRVPIYDGAGPEHGVRALVEALGRQIEEATPSSAVFDDGDHDCGRRAGEGSPTPPHRAPGGDVRRSVDEDSRRGVTVLVRSDQQDAVSPDMG